MAKAQVSNEDFVVAYATSDTLADVERQTGMSKAAIYSRRKMLSDKGVKFPKLSQKAVIDDLAIARMNSLIKKHDIRKKK